MTSLAKKLTSILPADSHWLEVTPGERFTVRTSVDDTDGAYSMIEVVAQPRNGVPMHIHTREDEHFLILEGSLHMANGDERLDVPAGAAVTVRKGVPHAWCNLGDKPVRMLAVFSPGHIEAMFRQISSLASDSLETLAAVASDQFGTIIVGPPIAEGLYTLASPRPAGTSEE